MICGTYSGVPYVYIYLFISSTFLSQLGQLAGKEILSFCGAIFGDKIQYDNRWVIGSPAPFCAQLKSKKAEGEIHLRKMTL